MCRALYERKSFERCPAQTTQTTAFVRDDFFGKIISSGIPHLFVRLSAQLMSTTNVDDPLNILPLLQNQGTIERDKRRPRALSTQVLLTAYLTA